MLWHEAQPHTAPLHPCKQLVEYLAADHTAKFESMQSTQTSPVTHKDVKLCGHPPAVGRNNSPLKVPKVARSHRHRLARREGGGRCRVGSGGPSTAAAAAVAATAATAEHRLTLWLQPPGVLTAAAGTTAGGGAGAGAVTRAATGLCAAVTAPPAAAAAAAACLLPSLPLCRALVHACETGLQWQGSSNGELMVEENAETCRERSLYRGLYIQRCQHGSAAAQRP